MAAKLGPDEVFRTLFEYCGKKPGATVDHPWGEVVFKVKKKIFAYIGRPGESAGVTVKPAPEELEELLARPNVNLAHYIGRYGWVNVSIADQAAMDLALRLVDETYEQIAHKKKPGPVLTPATAAEGETASAAKATAAAKPAGKAKPAVKAKPAGKAAAASQSSAADAAKKPKPAKKDGAAKPAGAKKDGARGKKAPS